jgi:23S rRNA pseudouridine2457 synthase
MATTLLFNKPCGVVCQFSHSGNKSTLKDFIPVKGVYPAGRLDTDSEGLLVLTDDGSLQAAISHPQYKLSKTYWVQVEGLPENDALRLIQAGIDLGDFVTRPAHARQIEEPAGIWPRQPPIRFRKNIPTSWLEIELVEGKNRQVRRMTAAAGHPTLRLIRSKVGPWTLSGLASGEYRALRPEETRLNQSS